LGYSPVGIALDFNNILQVIQGYGDMISATLPPEDPLSNDLTEMMKAANKATSLVRQLLSFSRRQSLEQQLVNLNIVIQDLMKILRRNAGERIDILFSTSSNRLCMSWQVPGRSSQVIMIYAPMPAMPCPTAGQYAFVQAKWRLIIARFQPHSGQVVTPNSPFPIPAGHTAGTP
jgi:hypothetical protein